MAKGDLNWQPFAVVARGPVRDASPADYDVDADDESEVFAIETATNADGETEKRESKLTGDERKRYLLEAVFGFDGASERLAIAAEKEKG